MQLFWTELLWMNSFPLISFSDSPRITRLRYSKTNRLTKSFVEKMWFLPYFDVGVDELRDILVLFMGWLMNYGK